MPVLCSIFATSSTDCSGGFIRRETGYVSVLILRP